MNAIRLKTEYLKNPIGIDEPLKEQEFAADRLCARGGWYRCHCLLLLLFYGFHYRNIYAAPTNQKINGRFFS